MAMIRDSDGATVDAVVIGAGVIGLAATRVLAEAGMETVTLEAADVIGSGVSSRNSEVIHAGLYYPPGSLKAKMCVAGRRMLYDYCRARGVAARPLGKLIVAAGVGQDARLDDIAARAAANGVDDLRRLTAAEAQGLEPALACASALLSPSTGVIDSHGLMLALQGDAEAAGAVVVRRTPYLSATCDDRGFVVQTGGAAPMRLRCRRLVNAAGLGAWDAARRLAGYPPQRIPLQRLAKGNYFTLSGGRTPFSRLIYPVPEDGGLGVHLTLDLAGQGRFGPDVEWLDDDDPAAVDYRVDPARGDAFYAAIRRYWPGLPDGALIPAYAGVRPKLTGPGGEADFMIDGPEEHGVPGLAQLFGIESPGLTSSLAVAQRVGEILA